MTNTKHPLRATLAATVILTSGCLLVLTAVSTYAVSIDVDPPTPPADAADPDDAQDPDEDTSVVTEENPAPIDDWPPSTSTPPTPSARPAPPPAEPPKRPSAWGDHGPSDVQSTVIRLANEARAKKNCAALTLDRHLERAARGFAQEMSRTRYFDHTSKDGRTFDERIRAAGYNGRYMGENIAYGYRSPAAVHQGWMDSPGHRRNILDCHYRHIGVGYTPNGRYWVQDFGA